MLIIVSGPSAVGKSRLCDAARESGIPVITPITTRPPRPGELNGGEYHFVDRQVFQSQIREQQLNDWDYVFGEYYGAYLADVQAAAQADSLFMIHALAKIAIRTAARFPSRVLTVMLHPSGDPEIIEARLVDRDEQEESTRQRVTHNFDEIAHAPLMDLVIRDADVRDTSEILLEIRSAAEKLSRPVDRPLLADRL